MTVYRIEPPPELPGDLYRSLAGAEKDETLPADLIYVGSGKAALDIILSFLGKTGVLPHKMTPILMPRWLGTWVYAQALPHGFPVLDVSEAAPVVMCYHQYGFPQDMDRVQDIARDRHMVLIEDCAHAAESRYKGRLVGTFAEYSLFSFSKFAFCYALGGVMSPKTEFREYVQLRLSPASKTLRRAVNGFKLLDEINSGAEQPRLVRTFLGFRNMAYSRYGDQVLAAPAAQRLWHHKRAGELAARRENYRLIRAEADKYGICDHLASDDVAPYAVPLILNPATSGEIMQALQASGVEARQYQFDMARCVFEPDFARCLLVPVHSGMTGRGMDILLSVVRKILQGRGTAHD